MGDVEMNFVLILDFHQILSQKFLTYLAKCYENTFLAVVLSTFRLFKPLIIYECFKLMLFWRTVCTHINSLQLFWFGFN